MTDPTDDDSTRANDTLGGALGRVLGDHSGEETPDGLAGDASAGDENAGSWREFEAVLALLKRLPPLVQQTQSDAVAILNGAVGDRLALDGSPLAIEMELRTATGRLDFSAPLGDQIAKPSTHLVVLVHGLMVTERYWAMGQEGEFGERLSGDVDVTPLYLRYNTGRHISENGRSFSALLETLVQQWPVEVESISLIGHSMGGLLCRSAAHYAAQPGDDVKTASRWLSKLRRVFLLGVPARGAPLEILAHVASLTLRAIPNPWTHFIAWAVKQRSAGIKDLRFAALVDEDWKDVDPDVRRLHGRDTIHLTDGVEHYVIGSTLVADSSSPWAQVLGDALVIPWSAKDSPVLGDGGEHLAAPAVFFPKMAHARVGWADAVYAQILAWWTSTPSD